jgi:starvation-inducible DNA-binding protein
METILLAPPPRRTAERLPCPTQNDLPEEVRRESAGLLNRLLASAIDLRQQAKQAHWNVKGPQFAALHDLFDAVAGEADGFADDLAERVASLGGTAHGTVQSVVLESELPELGVDHHWGCDHVQSLSRALATFGSLVRAAISEGVNRDDPGTADLFTQCSRATDKLLWKVEAHGWKA